MLSRVQGFDTWFGLDYGMNLYRGCQHRCIYCDSRSACYEIEDFDGEVLVKANAVERLRDELPRKRRKGIIGTGSMNDPYMPLEETVGLTRRSLEAVADHGFGVHVITKSDLVLRDIDVLKRIARTSRAAVSLTITTADDDLSWRVEPGAPVSSARFEALAALAREGIEARIALMPVLPFLEDSWENIEAIVDGAHTAGVTAIVAAFGMTLRDRQRDHFYRELDRLSPGLRVRYERQFADSYHCPDPSAAALRARFLERWKGYGVATSVQPWLVPPGEQLSLWCPWRGLYEPVRSQKRARRF